MGNILCAALKFFADTNNFWKEENTLKMNGFVVYQILSEHLHMRKVCAKIVPSNLTTQQDGIRKKKQVS